MSMALGMAPCSHLYAQGQTPVSQMEKLDRGLVALPAQDQGIFLSWRLLGTDSKNVCFDVERDGKIIAHQVKLTNYTDRKGSAASSYRIITYQDEPKMDAPAEREVSKAVKPWNDLYRSLPINRPAGGVTPDGKSYEYTPNDCSVGDVDGDGCDEITYGSAAINHDGTLLYSTGLGHGDAQHLADLDSDRPGLEYYMVHEEYPYGISGSNPDARSYLSYGSGLAECGI